MHNTEIENYLNDNGFPIGSRVWGGAKNDSDYDYVISHLNWSRVNWKFEREWKLGGKEHGKYREYGKYFTYENKTYNLICVNEDNISYWKQASEWMLQLPKDVCTVVKANKKFRIYIYEKLIEILKFDVKE